MYLIMPRPYSMDKRIAKVQQVRNQIVEAALAVHAERGILGTKPADVAARANVALTTYYKHFPSLGALVRACTTRGRELVPPPDPSILRTPSHAPAGRVATMVRTLFDYYEAREPWLYAGRTEERFVPELQPVLAAQRAARDAFVQATLAETGIGCETVAVATALVDFWTWRTMRRDGGLTQEEVINAVTTTIQRAASPR